MAKNTWGQNFGNSVRFGISSVSDKVLANLTPGIHSLLSKNDDYFNNIRETLMELKTGQTKVSSAIARTSPEMGKALEDINNALSTGFKNTTHFFKTGDISGPHKMPGADVEDSIGAVRDINLDDASADAAEKMDDAEEFNFDDLPSPEEAMAMGRDPGADAEIAGAKAQVGAIKASTEANVAGAKVVASNIVRVNNNISATGALVTKGLTANVKSMNQNFLMTNALMEKSMSSANETLKLVNENVARLVDFNKDTQSAHIKAAMSYYTDSLKELRSISESLHRAYPEHKAKEKPKSQYERALGYGFDLGEYFDVVKENFGRTEIGSMLSQVLDPQVLENYIARGPIVLLEELAPQIVPVVARTALKEFDQVVTSFIPALLGKLGAYADDMTANPVLQMIGSIFGIKSPGASMSLGQYEKGAVPFDGITHKTINQVIPTYLSKILAALTNTEEMHFDHETGTFKSMSQMRSENAADEDRLIRRSFGDLGYRLNRMDEDLGINFRNNEEQKLFREFINEFMKTGAYQGKFLNFNDEAQMDELFNTIRQTNQKFSQYEANNVGALEGWRDVLLNYIRNAPKSEQLTASMAGHEFYNELNKYYDQTKNTGSQKYAIVHSGFDDNKMASMVSAANARAREAGYGRTEYNLNTNGVILDNILNGLAFNNGGGPGNGGNPSGIIDPRRLTGVQGPIGKKARQIEMLLNRTSDPIVRQTLLAKLLESFDKESQEYAKTHDVKLRTTGSSQLQGDRYSAGFVADADRRQKELDALIDAIEKDETSEEYDKAATEEGQILIEDLRGSGAYENILRKNKERKEAARNQVNLEEYYENGGTKSVEELMAEGRYSDRNNNDLEQIYDEEELHEREYDKMGFTDKLKYSLLQKPSEVIASALGSVNEMLYRVIFGGDENVGALEAIVENVKSTFDGLKEWLVKDIFRPIKEYFIGDDFTESKFYKSMQSFFDFLKGEKDENGVYSGGFMSEMANEMSDMRKQAANLITGKEQTLSDGTKIGENADSLAGTAKSGWNTFSNAFKDQYFGDQKDSQEAQRNAMGNLIDQLNDGRKVEPSEAKPKTESNEAKPEGNKALGGGVPKSGTYILSAGETILGNYARGTRRIARNKGKRLRQKITKTGAYFLNEGADVLPAGTGSPSDIEKSQAAEANFMGKTLNYVFGSVRGAQDKTNILLSDVRNVLADKIVPATEDTAKATKAINESSGTETSSSDEKKEDKPTKPSDKAIFAQIDGLMKSIVGGNEEIQKYRKKPLIDVVFDKISNAAAQFAGALGGSKRFDTEYVQKEYAAAIRAKAPSAISKGLVGGVAVGGLNAIGAFGTLGSLLLPGGPIGGIMVGLGVSMLHHNDSFLKMMYGEVGADGKRQGGIIPKSTIDWVEKNKTAILGGTAFGALKALTGFSVLGMLPGMGVATATPIGALGMAGLEFIGPVLATIGIATAMRGDKMQKLLFGDPENADLKKTTGLLNGQMAKKVKQFLPNALVGAGGGYLGFSALNTMGLIGVAFQPWMGAILGGAMGIGLASDKFRDAMFGKMENGEFVSGGLVDQMKNFFKSEFITPAANFGLEMMNRADHFIKTEVMYPIAKAFEPYKAVIALTAKKIGKTLDGFFTKTKNFTLEVFKTITAPFRWLATSLFDLGRKALATTIRGAAKVAGTVATAPLQLLSFMAPSFKDTEYGKAIEDGKQRAEDFREEAETKYKNREKDIKARVEANDKAREYYRKNGYKDTQEQLTARTKEYKAEGERIKESQKKAELAQAERDANIREQTELLRGILDRMGYFIDYADDRGRARLVDAQGNVVHNTLNPDEQPVGSNIHGEGGAQEVPREKTADGKPATVEHTLQSMDKTEAEAFEQQKAADEKTQQLQEQNNDLIRSSLGWWNKLKMGIGRDVGQVLSEKTRKVIGSSKKTKDVIGKVSEFTNNLPPEVRDLISQKSQELSGVNVLDEIQKLSEVQAEVTDEQTDALVEKFDQAINAINQLGSGDQAPEAPSAEGESKEPKEKKKKEAGTSIIERERSQKEEYGKSDEKKYWDEQRKKKDWDWKKEILARVRGIDMNIEGERNDKKEFFDFLKGKLLQLGILAAGLAYALKSFFDNGGFNVFAGQIASDIGKYITRAATDVGRKFGERLKELADDLPQIIRNALTKEGDKPLRETAEDAARKGGREAAERSARRKIVSEFGEDAVRYGERKGVFNKLAHGFKIGSGEYQFKANQVLEGDKEIAQNLRMQSNYKYIDPEYAKEFAESNKQIVAKNVGYADEMVKLSAHGDDIGKIASGEMESKGVIEWFGKKMGELLDTLASKTGALDKFGAKSLGEVVTRFKGYLAKMTPKILMKYVPLLVEKISRVAANIPVIAGLFAMYDIYRGVNEAAAMFQIRPDQVTWKHKTAASVYNVIMGYLASKAWQIIVFDVFINVVQDMTGGSLAPVTFLVSMIYDCTFGILDEGIDNILGNAHESLSDKQAAFDKELEGVNDWRKQHGYDEMSKNDYIAYLEAGGDPETNPNYGKDNSLWGGIKNALGFGDKQEPATEDGTAVAQPSAEGQPAEGESEPDADQKPRGFWDNFDETLAWASGYDRSDIDAISKAKQLWWENQKKWASNGIDSTLASLFGQNNWETGEFERGSIDKTVSGGLAWLFGQNNAETGEYEKGLFAQAGDDLKKSIDEGIENIKTGWNNASKNIHNILEAFNLGPILAGIFGESDYYTTDPETGELTWHEGTESPVARFIGDAGKALKAFGSDVIDGITFPFRWLGKKIAGLAGDVYDWFRYGWADVADSVMTKVKTFLDDWGLGDTIDYTPGKYRARLDPNDKPTMFEDAKVDMAESFTGQGDYSQRDSRWGKRMYGGFGVPYALGGCGPTVMASVLSRMGKKVNPLELGTAASLGGYQTPNGGTGEYFLPDIANTFGVKSTKLGGMGDAIASLNAGKEVVLGGNSGTGIGPYTKAGHYARLAGIHGGRAYLADPRGFTSNVSLGTLARDTKTGYAFEGSGFGDRPFPDFSGVLEGNDLFGGLSKSIGDWVLDGGPLSTLFYFMKQDYNNMKKFYNENLSEPIDRFSTNVKKAIETVTDPFVSFANKASKEIGEKGILKGTFAMIKYMIGGFLGIDIDKTSIGQTANAMVEKIGKGIGAVRDTFKTIEAKFTEVGNKLKSMVFDSFIGKALETIIDFAKDKGGSVVKYAVDILQKWWSESGAKSFGLNGGAGGMLIPNAFGGRGLKQISGAWANKPVKVGHPELGTIKDGGCGIAGLLNNANSSGINMGLKDAQSAISSNNIAKDGSGLTGQFFKDAAAKSGNSFNQVGTDTPADMEKALGSGKDLIAGVQTGQGGHYVNARGLIKRGGKAYTMVDDPAGGSALMSTKALSGYINGPRSPRVLGYMSKGRGGRGGSWYYGGFGNRMHIEAQTSRECTRQAAAALYNAYTGENTDASDWHGWDSKLRNGPLAAEPHGFGPSNRSGFESFVSSHFAAKPANPIYLYQTGGDGNGAHPLNRVSGDHATVIGRKLADGNYEIYDSNGGVTHKLALNQIFDPTAKGKGSEGTTRDEANYLLVPSVDPSSPIDQWDTNESGSTATPGSSSGGINGLSSSISNALGQNNSIFGKLSSAVSGILGQAAEMALTGNIHEIDVNSLMSGNSSNGSSGPVTYNGTATGSYDVSKLPKGDLATAVSANTGLPADLILAQWGQECGRDFSSELSRNYHNHGGMKTDQIGTRTSKSGFTWTTTGEDKKGHSYFDSDQSFVNYCSYYYPLYKPDGIMEAKTPAEWVRAIKHGGYFTGDENTYRRNVEDIWQWNRAQAAKAGGSGGPLIPKEFGGKGYIHGGRGALTEIIMWIAKNFAADTVLDKLIEILSDYPALQAVLRGVQLADPIGFAQYCATNYKQMDADARRDSMACLKQIESMYGYSGNGKPLIKPPKMYRSRSGGKGFGGLSSMMHNGGMGSTDDFLPMSHNQFVFDNHINTPNGADSTSILNMMKYLSIKAEAKVMIEYLKRIADNTFGGMKVNVTGGGSSPLINGGKGYTDQTSFKLPSERPTMNKADFEASQRLTNPGGNNGLSAMHMKNLEIARGGSFRSL